MGTKFILTPTQCRFHSLLPVSQRTAYLNSYTCTTNLRKQMFILSLYDLDKLNCLMYNKSQTLIQIIRDKNTLITFLIAVTKYIKEESKGRHLYAALQFQK